VNDFSMAITGDKKLVQMFHELPARAQERVLKPLIQKGAALTAAMMRGEAPTMSGLMQLAVGPSKLRTYHGLTILVAVGVRRGYRRAVQGTRYRGGWARRTRYLSKAKSVANPELPIQDPAKYLSIVTRGRKALTATKGKVLADVRTGRIFGKSVAAASPNPFVDRTFNAAKTTVGNQIASEAADRILAEAESILK
jgi:hypothetical protein